ncbi:MAG: hypothetical protein Ct9H300mP8_10670 [Gammaproteobacteria bacterium]|nr:MAG: hypothetical protein Ct9H300mP8_10670 [Gammaproteobacteria bacterium]
MKWLSERRTPILVGISLMTVVAAAVGSRMYFDYSVLALRDPDSESMRTLALLQEEEIVTDYTLSILTQDDQETRNLNRLLDLPRVWGKGHDTIRLRAKRTRRQALPARRCARFFV